MTPFSEKLLNIKCVLIFSATFIRDISHSKKNSRTYCPSYMYIDLRVKYPLFLSDFLDKFRKILEYKILWKSVTWEPSSMRTDGWTDRQT
jgi:hypothetical protein